MTHAKFTTVGIMLTMCLLWLGGCGSKQAQPVNLVPEPPKLSRVEQIDSFKPESACRQGLEVVQNTTYSEEYFHKVFARIVEQCGSNKQSCNADIIWDEFVQPLAQSGKVPPDLAKVTWNEYFSRSFVSLPVQAGVGSYCHQLADIKARLEREYQLKIKGFEITNQGSPDKHFLNAMYVYNTIWAACHSASN